MKKFFVFSMLGVLLFTGNLFADDSKSIPPAGDDLVISLKIIFHRPKLECERGFGICLLLNISWEESKVTNDQNHCLARGWINERNQLVIEVKETDLTKYEGGSTLAYFKDKTSISIIDPYPLSDETCRAFGTKPPKTIKPGNYPVSYENGVYTVIFQL